MSINELEAKARELRQLQALIDEAQAEAEALKDAIGDQDSIQAGEYRVFCQVKIPGFAKANSLVLPREFPGNCQINSLVLPRYFTRMRALRRR